MTAHARWKVIFGNAISARTPLDVATISRDDCCALGQWLHREGNARWGNRPEFVEAIDKHKRFHDQAGAVAQMINEAKYSEALEAIGRGSTYSDASNEVAITLIALKKFAESDAL